MRTIWKFPLKTEAWIPVNCGPGVIRFVAIDPATGEPAIWVELDVEPDPDRLGGARPAIRGVRTFGVFGTGRPILYGVDFHMGSMIDGRYVWHVYERVRC